MSENVIKFPTKAKQRDAIKMRLNTAINSMDQYYEAIDDIMQEMARLEEEVAKIEADYSQVLREYAKVTASEDLESRFLAYDNQCDVHWDGDTNSLVFKLAFDPTEAGAKDETEE